MMHHSSTLTALCLCALSLAGSPAKAQNTPVQPSATLTSQTTPAQAAPQAQPGNHEEVPLVQAIFRGQYEEACRLLEAGAPVNQAGDEGKAPLAAAIEMVFDTFPDCGGGDRWRPFVETLLKRGADVKQRDARGKTPLHEAIPDLTLTRLLIQHGANPNAEDARGWTPFLIAAANGSMDLVEYLRKVGGRDTVCSLTLLEDAEGLRNMVFGARGRLNEVLPSGETPLYLAAGHPATARLLLELGTDPLSYQSSQTGQPLHQAAKLGNADLTRRLLDAGVNANTVDSYGDTALFEAAQSGGGVEVARLLLERGCDLRHRNNRGKTALDAAVNHPNLPLVKLLLEHDPALADKQEWTTAPLEMARQNLRRHLQDQQDNPDGPPGNVLPMLIALGDPEQLRQVIPWQEDYLRESLFAAARHGTPPVAEVLVKHGADVKVRDRLGKTPLHYAVEWENKAMVQFLIAHGAAPDAKDVYGETPTALARRMGRQDWIM